MANRALRDVNFWRKADVMIALKDVPLSEWFTILTMTQCLLITSAASDNRANYNACAIGNMPYSPARRFPLTMMVPQSARHRW